MIPCPVVNERGPNSPSINTTYKLKKIKYNFDLVRVRMGVKLSSQKEPNEDSFKEKENKKNSLNI